MKLAILVVVATCAIAIAPVRAPAQEIILASNLDGTSCELPAPPGTSFAFYVLVPISSVTADGVTAAEFRIAGLPAGTGWSFTFVANPEASVVLGNALVNGINIAFPACQTGVDGFVLLGTVHGQNHSDSGGYALRVSFRAPPITFPYPSLNLCGPDFDRVYASGGTLLLNAASAIVTPPRSPVPADGAMSISTATHLSWQPGTIAACESHSAPTQSLRLGTDPNPPVVWSGNETTYDPGPLLSNTQYYWDVRLCYADLCAVSPLWSFRTDENVATHSIEWTGLKRLFR